MAKCRIASMNKLFTPQMELRAAVLSKPGKKVIEKEMRFKFEKVLQIVNSEIVLNMINKTSTRFKVYEGRRIGEIQAAKSGDMSCWAWMSGHHNPTDWLTHGRTPEGLNQESEWWVVARLKNIARNNTFSAGNTMQVTAQHLKEAEDSVVKNI